MDGKIAVQTGYIIADAGCINSGMEIVASVLKCQNRQQFTEKAALQPGFGGAVFRMG